MLEEFPEQDQVYEADVEMIDDLGMMFFFGFSPLALTNTVTKNRGRSTRDTRDRPR